jgi:hypothetical protein
VIMRSLHSAELRAAIRGRGAEPLSG